MVRVVPAHTPEEVEVVRTLFAEYAALPHTAGRWDDSAGEVESLPGPYAPPLGEMLLALADGLPVGCVAIRPLDPPAVCEMKRLFVRERMRGLGAGRALVEASIGRARESGYSLMRLDTAPELDEARALYLSLGFREIDRYRDDLSRDAMCFELEFG